MSEILVFAGNNRHADPEKDQRGCYKRGYIVDVQKDGFEWGSDVDPASAPRMPNGSLKFVIIRMQGVSAERLRRYVTEHEDDAGGLLLRPVRRRRRLWQLQWSEIPANVRTRLTATGAVGMTWPEFKSLLVRADTGARETEDLAE